jgi:hypothetical protein
MKIAAVALVPLFAAAPALAQQAPADPQPETVHVDTLVVVTPNPPVVVTTNGGAVGGGPSTIAPAKAATDVADAENPPPHNEDWSNVSHINGRLVPVGERNAYLYKYKKTNIATNPIGMMFGFYGLSVSYAVGPHVAIRGDVSIYNHNDQTETEFGISAPIYFKRMYSGPFFEPGLVVRTEPGNSGYSYSGGGYYTQMNDTYVAPEMMFGWHWTFDWGLNVAAALGAMKRLDNNGNSDPRPAGYFRIGYAF